jgi:hypothetical protein
MVDPRTRDTIAADYQAARDRGDAGAMRRYQNEEACFALLAILERLAADEASCHPIRAWAPLGEAQVRADVLVLPSAWPVVLAVPRLRPGSCLHNPRSRRALMIQETRSRATS